MFRKLSLGLPLILIILSSCKKEIDGVPAFSYLQSVRNSLKDSMKHDDFLNLDFTRAILSKVDSVQFYILRIPFEGKEMGNDFVIVKTSVNGEISGGSIVHLEGGQVEYGQGDIKRRVFNGDVSISALNGNKILRSVIKSGFILALHPQYALREETDPVFAVDDLPEVVVVAYIHDYNQVSFSTYLWLSSLMYDSGGGDSGERYGNYYGSMYGSDLLTDWGGGSYSDGTGSYSGVSIESPIQADIETYVDHPGVDIDTYLKCFDNIPDDGATCSIEIFTDIPVDDDPSKLFNWQTRSPGHTFLQLVKTNGSSSVLQNIGFYPTTNYKNILEADPVGSKIVDDGLHEANASLKMNVTPFQMKAVISKMKELSTRMYDIDEFNCTDYALEVFNYVRNPLQIPLYNVPGGVGLNLTRTPQGLYVKLKEMKENNDKEASSISIGYYKAYVAKSNGPCN